jgi:uncharacterized membrane protein YecN with MAPEG domain
MPYHVEFSIDISAIYIAAAGLFLVFLALDVVRARWKYGEGSNEKSGEKGMERGGVTRSVENNEDPLSRRIRVHANAAEYFSVALLLLVAVENIVAIGWVVHALGILLLASRLIHAAGLRGMAGESLPRTLGTVGTMTMVSVSAILVLVNSF